MATVEERNNRNFQRFLAALREGRDYAFLSLYFFTTNDAQVIHDEIMRNSTLEFLSMPSCYAGRRKMVPIITALRNNPVCRLISLDISDNRLEDSGMAMVAEYLKHSTTLESVALKQNRITSGDGATAIAQVLTRNTTLKKLDISSNKLEAEGIAKIDTALTNNTSLEELGISDNGLGAEGVANMRHMLTNNATLKKILLQYNNIGDEGALILANYLQGNETLESVVLLEKYLRLQVCRGLMSGGKNTNLNMIFFPQDFHDAKIKAALDEWEAAKNNGQELISVPREVFEFQDAAAVKAFLKAALVEGLSANKAVKMLMVGRARAGKTSLTNSLVNDISGLTKDDDDRATVSVEIRPWVVNDVTISIWDFAGQEEYYMTHTFFLSRRCVVVLIVDLSAYKDFDIDVYYWVKAIQAHIPGVRFFLVGTHIDNMQPEEVKKVSKEIIVSFHESERRVISALEKQLEVAEESGTDMSHVREQKDRRPQILHNMVFPVSSKEMTGIPELRKLLMNHATAKEVAIRLPNSYVKLLNHIHTWGQKNHNEPILARSDIRKVIGSLGESFKTDDDLDAALELLHLVGQILWYRENAALMDRVFASPRWVVDITKALVRHDMFKTEHGRPGVIHKLKKPESIRAKDWSKMKDEFYKNATFDLRFLALLDTWKDVDELHRRKLVSLLKQFELMIELPKKKKSDSVKCLVPIYLRRSFHPEFENKRFSLRKSIVSLIGGRSSVQLDKHRVIWRYDMQEYFPEGIFFRLLTRCYTLGKIKFVSDQMLYANVGPDIKIVIHEDRASSNISIACSHKTNLQLAWPAFVLYALEMENLLRTAYQGVQCGIMCVASDSRLRERELCNHEQHFDMVPPLPYMHVIFGHISAVQVGIMLRFDNIEEQLLRMNENKSEKSETQQSEIDLMGKEAFLLLERLLKNICVSNQIQVVNGRDYAAYLEAAKPAIEEKSYMGLVDVREHYVNVETENGLLDALFIQSVLEVGRTLLPDLPEIETSKMAGYANYEPSAQLRDERKKVNFDAAAATKLIE